MYAWCASVCEVSTPSVSEQYHQRLQNVPFVHATMVTDKFDKVSQIKNMAIKYREYGELKNWGTLHSNK
jgi:hypothetical protein